LVVIISIELKSANPNAEKAASENPFSQYREIVKKNLSNVGKVIAVHSGKGGVGKSTFSVNLAAFLAQKGFSSGLLDADIDCPSCNKMFGITERIKSVDGKFVPIEAFGVKVISAGNMVANSDEANVMRGPMMFKLIFELLAKTDWGSLDYLIIDLPPGTGDNPLTVMQLAPLYGIVVVTQPQEVAVVDAKKSVNMAAKTNIPVIGIVENMFGTIFGSGGAENAADSLEISFLGKIPLEQSIRESSDAGIPDVIKNKKLAGIFDSIISEAAI